MTGWIVALILAFVLGAGVGAALLRRHYRRQGKFRVIEKPNSHYAAPGVQRIERRERWEAILQRQDLHELNRSEVERLLTKVQALGDRSLTSSEKSFLDRMSSA